MTKVSAPRIQFRLSKLSDKDLIDVFTPIVEQPDKDVTAEVKRLIRLGLEYESLLDDGVILVKEPKFIKFR